MNNQSLNLFHGNLTLRVSGKKRQGFFKPCHQEEEMHFRAMKQQIIIASTQSPLSIAMFEKYGMWQIVAGCF
jgi:hypothetical protein